MNYPVVHFLILILYANTVFACIKLPLIKTEIPSEIKNKLFGMTSNRMSSHELKIETFSGYTSGQWLAKMYSKPKEIMKNEYSQIYYNCGYMSEWTCSKSELRYLNYDEKHIFFDENSMNSSEVKLALIEATKLIGAKSVKTNDNTILSAELINNVTSISKKKNRYYFQVPHGGCGGAIIFEVIDATDKGLKLQFIEKLHYL